MGTHTGYGTAGDKLVLAPNFTGYEDKLVLAPSHGPTAASPRHEGAGLPSSPADPTHTGRSGLMHTGRYPPTNSYLARPAPPHHHFCPALARLQVPCFPPVCLSASLTLTLSHTHTHTHTHSNSCPFSGRYHADGDDQSEPEEDQDDAGEEEAGAPSPLPRALHPTCRFDQSGGHKAALHTPHTTPYALHSTPYILARACPLALRAHLGYEPRAPPADWQTGQTSSGGAPGGGRAPFSLSLATAAEEKEHFSDASTCVGSPLRCASCGPPSR